MDRLTGLPATHCPPLPCSPPRFRAAPSGTFWYHSHMGLQYGDGARGPFIVEVGGCPGPAPLSQLQRCVRMDVGF